MHSYPLYVSGTENVRFEIPRDTAKKGIIRYSVTLPQYVTCSHCVVQWNYYTGTTSLCLLTSVFLASPLSFLIPYRFSPIRKYVGFMRERHGSRRLRKSRNISQLRRREDRHQHRRHTAASLDSQHHLRAVLCNPEILPHAISPAVEVNRSGNMIRVCDCCWLCVMWILRFQGTSVRAHRGFPTQAEYERLVSSKLHSHSVKLPAGRMSLFVSIKLPLQWITFQWIVINSHARAPSDRSIATSRYWNVTKSFMPSPHSEDVLVHSCFVVFAEKRATLSATSHSNLVRISTVWDTACIIRPTAQPIVATVIE